MCKAGLQQRGLRGGLKYCSGIGISHTALQWRQGAVLSSEVYIKRKFCTEEVTVCLAVTCSRKDRDLLMYVASLAMAPSAPVLAERSDPAKSTMFSFECHVLPSAGNVYVMTESSRLLMTWLPMRKVHMA